MSISDFFKINENNSTPVFPAFKEAVIIVVFISNSNLEPEKLPVESGLLSSIPNLPNHLIPLFQRHFVTTVEKYMTNFFVTTATKTKHQCRNRFAEVNSKFLDEFVYHQTSSEVFINLILINRLAKEPLSPIEKIILKRRLNKIKANYYILSGYWFLLRNGLKMMDWGYICIIIGIFLAITQFYIAYQLPELDTTYSWLIFRTHHYIEMPGALLLGIELSRILKKTGPRDSRRYDSVYQMYETSRSRATPIALIIRIFISLSIL